MRRPGPIGLSPRLFFLAWLHWQRISRTPLPGHLGNLTSSHNTGRLDWRDRSSLLSEPQRSGSVVDNQYSLATLHWMCLAVHARGTNRIQLRHRALRREVANLETCASESMVLLH